MADDIDRAIRIAEKGLEHAESGESAAEGAASQCRAVQASLASVLTTLHTHECKPPVDPPAPSGPRYWFDAWQTFPAATREEPLTSWPDTAFAEVLCWVYPFQREDDGVPLGIFQFGEDDGAWLGEQQLKSQRPYEAVSAPHPVDQKPIFVSAVLGAPGERILAPLVVGAIPMHGTMDDTAFNGMIGGFKVFSRWLSDDERAALEAAGPPPGELPVIEPPVEPPIEPPVEPPNGGNGNGFPAWQPPSRLVHRDGGYDPAANPSSAPKNGAVIERVHYTQWLADDYWRPGGGGGQAAVIEGRGIGRDPSLGWTLRDSLISGVKNGHAINGHYGVWIENVWAEDCDNIVLMADDAASIVVRGFHARDVCNGQPQLIWDNTGALKITGGGAERAGAPSTIDVDGFYVDRAWNGMAIWVDWRVLVQQILNLIMRGGCRWRGLMIEMSAGARDSALHLENAQLAHCCQEAWSGPNGPDWSAVFNGSFLIMNSENLRGEGLTIVTSPTPSSCFAFQDDAGPAHKGRPGAHEALWGLDGYMTVTRNIDFRYGLLVLRGPNSTVSRAYAQKAGLDGALSNIRIRDFEVLVEGTSESAARARANTFGTSSLNVKAMTAQQIDDELQERGLEHLV